MFWRTQTKLKGLTPAIGASPNFVLPQKVLSDSNNKESAREKNNDGDSLIAQGKLKEARDWYRSQNNNVMACILSDIIRSQKGVELRKAAIEEYRKSKNREQISRIIKEIEEYIDLCEKAGLNSSEYKKLLADYRKI